MKATERRTKNPPPVVVQWLEFLRRSLKITRVSRLRISEDSLVILAGHIALVGPTTSEVAVQVYQALVKLLFSWRRLQWRKGDSLAGHLRLLPTSTEGLHRLAVAVEAAGAVESLERTNFPIQNFIAVALQLTDPVAYIEVCRKDGFEHIREIFHPNTLKAVAQKYRGVVGDLASPEYRRQISLKIKTVT